MRKFKTSWFGYVLISCILQSTTYGYIVLQDDDDLSPSIESSLPQSDPKDTESNESVGDADLAEKARNLLVARCTSCHGDEFQGHASMSFYNLETLIQDGLVVPNEPEESLVYQRVRDGEMPQDEPLPPEEAELIRRWIAGGAVGTEPKSKGEHRNTIQLNDTYSWIAEDVKKQNRESRPYLRYLSLANQFNDNRIADDQLNRTRVALSKMVNSLSHESSVVVPAAVDEAATLFRIDIRDYGWHAQQWSNLEKQYPYGLRPIARDEEDTLISTDQINSSMGVSHSFIRVDWFVDTVARPHFYHHFLRLPMTVGELEHSLGVHADRNIQNYRVMQAGFATSGVSNGNRMLQRHPSKHGMYWKSFDFTDDSITGNLFQRPLNLAETHTEERFVMEFDGGEMIFSLPNGLQGYYLSDAKGNRLDRGPIEVVRDERRTGGTAEVINAISCLNCHARGLIDFKDSVRDGHVLSGSLARRVEQLYPKTEVMDKQVQKDTERFVSAMKEVIGEWGAFENFSNPTDEPIGSIVRRYQQDLDLETAAAELGVPSEQLLSAIESNNNLIRSGLRPLTKSARIKRSAWADRSSFLSPMQTAARNMKVATPSN